ncbi:MAG: hypothetical protein ACO1OQ_06355 [Rufibacter sp.]
MQIGVTKHIKISYRPDMHTVIIRWQQPVTFTEFKMNCLAILQMARENQATSWLFDCRSKGEMTQEESEWLSQEFYPKALHLIAPSLLVAWLLNPRQMQMLHEGNGLSAVNSSNASLEVRRNAFLTEQEAVKWLEECAEEACQKLRKK